MQGFLNRWGTVLTGHRTLVASIMHGRAMIDAILDGHGAILCNHGAQVDRRNSEADARADLRERAAADQAQQRARISAEHERVVRQLRQDLGSFLTVLLFSAVLYPPLW